MRKLLTRATPILRIDGPLNHQQGERALRILHSVQKARTNSLMVVVNSHGGPLSVARIIADSIQRIKKQTKVYCFAEEFCLNSANLILAAGSQSYASEFSVMGDFGFAREHFEWDDFEAKHKIGLQRVGTHKPSIDHFGNLYQVSDTGKAGQLVQSDAVTLKKGVTQLRRAAVDSKKLSVSDLQSKLTGGQMAPQAALQLGLIDGLETCESLAKKHGLRVREQEESLAWLWRLLNPYGNILNIFRRD